MAVSNVESVTCPPLGSTTPILIRVEARGRVLISLSSLSLHFVGMPSSSVPMLNKLVLTSPPQPISASPSTGLLSGSRIHISPSSSGAGSLGSSFSSIYGFSTAVFLPGLSSFDRAGHRPCRMADRNRGMVPAKKGRSAIAEAQMMATVDSRGVHIPPLESRLETENPMRRNLMAEMSTSLSTN